MTRICFIPLVGSFRLFNQHDGDPLPDGKFQTTPWIGADNSFPLHCHCCFARSTSEDVEKFLVDRHLLCSPWISGLIFPIRPDLPILPFEVVLYFVAEPQ